LLAGVATWATVPMGAASGHVGHGPDGRGVG
jgi:hypothetical protein